MLAIFTDFIVTSFKAEHPLNAPEPIVVNSSSGSTMLSSAVQPPNALASMDTRLYTPKSILFRDVHPLNILSGRTVIEPVIAALSSAVQPSNVLVPTLSTVLGMNALVISVQSLNASAPMCATV